VSLCPLTILSQFSAKLLKFTVASVLLCMAYPSSAYSAHRDLHQTESDRSFVRKTLAALCAFMIICHLLLPLICLQFRFAFAKYHCNLMVHGFSCFKFIFTLSTETLDTKYAFLPRPAMHKHSAAVVRRLSVRPSCCLSGSCIVSEQITISSVSNFG